MLKHKADFRQTLYAYERQQRMPYVTTVEQAGIQQGEALILLTLLQEKFGHDSADAGDPGTGYRMPCADLHEPR